MSAPAVAQLNFALPDEDAAELSWRIMTRGGQHSVFAEGTIVEGDATRLQQFLDNRGIESAIIVFNSDGGDLIEGLRLGKSIRARGLDTGVGNIADEPAICASACAYAFAGGVNRYYDSSDTLLGLHQFSRTGPDGMSAVDVQRISGVLVSYLSDMGVDALAFSVSAAAAPEEMFWLSTSEAEELGFANNGTLPTTSEIRLSGMTPYLRLEQIRQTGHVRILVTCFEGSISLMAGVVTDPEQSQFHASISQRSYIEIDGEEALVMGPGGAEATASVLWLDREVDVRTLARLLQGSRIDVWTEGGGAFRWGGHLDLRPVNSALRDYVTNCFGSRN